MLYRGAQRACGGHTCDLGFGEGLTCAHTHPHSNVYTAYNCKSHFKKATTLSCVRVRTCAAKTRELMASQSRQQGLQTLSVTLSDRRGQGLQVWQVTSGVMKTFSLLPVEDNADHCLLFLWNKCIKTVAANPATKEAEAGGLLGPEVQG